jgi:hypothetical protein
LRRQAEFSIAEARCECDGGDRFAAREACASVADANLQQVLMRAVRCYFPPEIMTDRLFQYCVAMALVLLACKSDPGAPRPAPSAMPDTSSAAPISNAETTLDALDSRTPVPLLPMMANHQKQNMRDHLLAVQEIIAALATRDFTAIQKSAGRIGYSEQMGQMCTHMGAGASGFTETALEFHHVADTISQAAKKQDSDAVLAALTRTLSTCTSCHARFKQRVVDERTWATLTKRSPPNGSGHP